MPNVIGQSQAQAVSTLTAAALDYKIITETSASPPGSVVGQSPPVSSVTAAHSVVTIEVSEDS